MKHFHTLTWDDVHWNRSYANISMLMASIPEYELPKTTTGDEPKKEVIEEVDGFDGLKDLFKDE